MYFKLIFNKKDQISIVLFPIITIFVNNFHKKHFLGMILEFSITNFRSIREKQTFSMLAYGSQSKLDNTFEVELANGDHVRLLKTAGIYGANSFGKSNLIHAFFNFTKLINSSSDNKVDQEIKYYEPFLFNIDSKDAPTEFEISFVGKNKHKYHYFIAFNKKEILSEVLEYYPKKQKQTIFKRYKNGNSLVHKAKLGKKFGAKEYELYGNQLLLSKFGKDIPNEFLAEVFLYFGEIEIWNIDKFLINLLKKVVINDLKKTENKFFLHKLNKLMRVADTKIESLMLSKTQKTDLPENMPEETKTKIMQADEDLFARHWIYDSDKNIINHHDLVFSEESIGTQFLFALGGRILKKLEKGGIIMFDEFDMSLHPFLSRFLIQLYNHPISNPNKAQLIFVSHEPHILDKNIMRADQIWFTDKNEFGETEIYSAQDFDNIREDIPFDKWYLAGKFGAIPTINDSDIQTIFEDEKES
ncbi:MAG: ATP-binding protein [Bacteroidetes bacterium]|nr:MAG: ATP-binding protein [Bacteroidota bacterium]